MQTRGVYSQRNASDATCSPTTTYSSPSHRPLRLRPHIFYTHLPSQPPIHNVWTRKGWQGEQQSLNTVTVALNARRGIYRVSERAAPSVTARFFVTTSRVSPSRYVTRHMCCCRVSDKLIRLRGNHRLSVVLPVVVVSSVSLVSSTRSPAVSSRSSWRTSSVTLSRTLSTPRGMLRVSRGPLRILHAAC